MLSGGEEKGPRHARCLWEDRHRAILKFRCRSTREEVGAAALFQAPGQGGGDRVSGMWSTGGTREEVDAAAGLMRLAILGRRERAGATRLGLTGRKGPNRYSYVSP